MGRPSKDRRSRLGYKTLFHPILDFGEGGAGTFFIKVAARSTAHSDRTDRGCAGHDSHPADCISNIGQRSLRHRARRSLAHPVGDGFRAIFLARERQRCLIRFQVISFFGPLRGATVPAATTHVPAAASICRLFWPVALRALEAVIRFEPHRDTLILVCEPGGRRSTQISRKLRSLREWCGCLSLRSVLASICRIRSRVTENCFPTSSKV
jgi:hypothetical protein